MNIYESACEKAQEGLWNCFFDEKTGVMVNHMPVRKEENWIYWWHAHALDALLDGYLRKPEGEYQEHFRMEYEGTYRENGNTLLHNWYDDMEWMTLALLRAWDATKDEEYKKQALFVWEDIKTAWNDACGGGMAWKKGSARLQKYTGQCSGSDYCLPALSAFWKERRSGMGRENLRLEQRPADGS